MRIFAEQSPHLMLRSSLEEKEKILIIGGNPSNFNGEYRDNPSITFWDSTDPATSRKTTVPKGTTLIILTRFIGNELDRIRSITPSGCQIIGPLNIGIIKKWLGENGLGPKKDTDIDPSDNEEVGVGEIVNISDLSSRTKNPQTDSETVQATPPQGGGRRFKKGELLSLIMEVAEYESKSPATEIEKVYQAALARGFKANKESIRQVFQRSREVLLAPPAKEKSSPAKTEKLEKKVVGTSTPITSPQVRNLRAVVSDLESVISQNEALRKEVETLHKELRKVQVTNKKLAKAKKELNKLKAIIKKAQRRY